MPEWIVDLFARYGYAVVFAGVFLENTGLPVPGETALLAGAALKHPLVGIGTDSAARAEDGRLSESTSHPRAWGSFPRILGRYVRDEHLLTLEEAIRKMTSKAAARVHLSDRGVLRPGMAADLTIFDPATIRDVATFEDPKHYSVGVKHVLVNGRRVVADGVITSERPGRPLRGIGSR